MLTNIFLQTRDIIQGISIATPSCWGKQFAAKLQAAAKLGVGAEQSVFHHLANYSAVVGVARRFHTIQVSLSEKELVLAKNLRGQC